MTLRIVFLSLLLVSMIFTAAVPAALANAVLEPPAAELAAPDDAPMMEQIPDALGIDLKPDALSIDQKIDKAIQPIADKAIGLIFYPVTLMGQDIPMIIIWLMSIGVFTSFYFGFINFRLLRLSCQLLGGKHQSEKREGQISNWQALSTSLSATVGLGNIAGVAVAISMGGPGATVWMIVMGFLGMNTKFIECALGVKYRKIAADGEVSGGPMYYISRGFTDRGLPGIGKVLAAFFAFCCIGGAIGGGNMFQSNQTYQMFMRVAGEGSFFADKGWLFGVVVALLVGVVIIGGIKSIARVSEKIFPVMATLYILMCLVVIVGNYQAVPAAFADIIRGAFAPEAAVGGILGALIAGVRRAVFSNEAGIGSAPITHAAVKCDSHIAQGLISMLNPFIDTVIICTMTALVIAVTGVYQGGQGIEGVALTARAFETVGGWTIYWLGLTVFLFAFSTMIAWYYLGEKGFTYIAGRSPAKVMAFKVFYCLFIVVGAAANLTHLIDLTDALFFAMAIPNVVVLYMMAPEIKKDLRDYLEKIRASA